MDDKFLQTAQFLGLECTGQSGEEVTCTCPKCGKERHFYWNVEKSVGHCKVCDLNPHKMELISALLDELDDEMAPGCLARLAKDRGLPLEAFQGYGLKYIDGMYILPVRGFDGKLTSLRSYRLGQKLQIMGGCPAALFGAERLGEQSRKNEHVYVCEGEWDAIAYHWLLKTTKTPGVVVGVPGAGTFKSEWISAFKGRWVYLAYDNDEAGHLGAQKVSKMLAPHVPALAILHWGPSQPEGYDIRDFVISKLTALK